MQPSLTTTFRGLHGSDVLEAQIQRRVEKLGTYCDSIMGARVLVELAGRHHRSGGNQFHVRIHLTLPGEDLLIEHKASGRPAARALAATKARKQDELDRGHVYAGVAIREAFEAARRRLQDHMRRIRGGVKAHSQPLRGRDQRLTT